MWTGTCINVSGEGALLKLEGPWSGAEQIAFELDPGHVTESLPVPARVIRASSPDHLGTFLAVKFLGPS